MDPKILLINPRAKNDRAKFLPLGLAYLAAVLEKNSFDVKVIDANALQMEDNCLINTVKKMSPDIIGLTAMTGGIEYVWEIAKMCKLALPNATLILGGPHPTILPEESIQKLFVDIVVIGEGEETMKEIAVSRQKNSSLKNVKGIAYKEDGRVIITPRRENIVNLDDLPFPARHLFPFPQLYKSDSYRKKPVARILTSRGCPYRCTFCYHGIFGRELRTRSPENVVEEIEFLKDRYGIKEFHIVDDNFNADKKRAIAICELLIKRKVNLPWACAQGMRVNNLDQEFLYLIREAGCYRTYLGIESGNQQILNNIQKDITLAMVEKAVVMVKKAKMVVGGLFMVGNYGETEETINDTINFAKKLKLDYASFCIATPYPGTVLRQQVIQEGRLLTKKWSDLNRFTGAAFEWKNLSKSQIDRLYRKAYRDFYLRPGYLFKRLTDFESFKILFRGIGIVINALRLKDIFRK